MFPGPLPCNLCSTWSTSLPFNLKNRQHSGEMTFILSPTSSCRLLLPLLPGLSHRLCQILMTLLPSQQNGSSLKASTRPSSLRAEHGTGLCSHLPEHGVGSAEWRGGEGSLSIPSCQGGGCSWPEGPSGLPSLLVCPAGAELFLKPGHTGGESTE